MATGTALSAKAEPGYWPVIARQWWENDLGDFRLMTLDECEQHFETLVGDPEPYMQQFIRAFVNDETLAPNYQFGEDGLPDRVVQALFMRALELKVPHNSFIYWLLPPAGEGLPAACGRAGVPGAVMEYLEDFARNRP